jgi:polyhydroxybutyrate depolymerase
MSSFGKLSVSKSKSMPQHRILRHSRTISAALWVGLGLIVGCSIEAEPPVPPGSGGAAAGVGGSSAGIGGSAGTVTGGSAGKGVAGSVATGGTAGGSASGGTTGGAGQNGGAGSGGQSGSAGSSGSGGAGSGGAGNAGMSAGGASSGGMSGAGTGGSAGGGSGGASGGTGGKAPVDASDGCDKANPQTGSSGSPLMVSGHQYYVKLPSAYEPSKPYPVIFVFNPTNNPISWAEQSAGFEQNGAKDAWIRVYPHPANSSAGWNGSDVSFFQPLYDNITNNFCVDKARVFATGESSGGDFSSILGCEHADKLRGVGPCATKPVSGYPLNAGQRDCTGTVTAVVIHGKNDNVVGPENGPATRDFYVEVNNCTSMSMPVAGYTDTLSNCVEFQGCDAGFPVIWCQHTDPNYSNTNHGWPAFAPKFLFEKFSSY